MAMQRRTRTRCIFDNIIVLLLLPWSSSSMVPAVQGNPQISTGPTSILAKSAPPIVYTIAGSDSGGGAGIQADLHAIHSFGCHGCSAVTCLTAQNSVGVTAVHTPDPAFLQEQLRALYSDLPPSAIKIGMLATQDVAKTVGAFLRELRRSENDNQKQSKVWVVVDPVMISTSGSRLLDEEAQQTLIDHVLPYADIITPNKFEAEALLQGRTLTTASDVEQAARDLLELGNIGVNAVLIKGGHTDEGGQFVRDYLLVRRQPISSSTSTHVDYEPRVCDAALGVWLQSKRYDTIHTHGTGCTLSSSMAAALALGESSRSNGDGGGAIQAMALVDACCLAKAYVSAGICRGVQLGKGPGPVAHTVFPSSSEHFPLIVVSPTNQNQETFLSMKSSFATEIGGDNNDDRPTLGLLLPIVDSVEWVEHLCVVSSMATPGDRGVKVKDLQLRIKGETDASRVLDCVQQAQTLCEAAGIRLWINDYWEAAVSAGCFGVHLGQEDLYRCVQTGGLDALRKNRMALGISTHTFGELAAALGIGPTYVSLGPIFATESKNVQFHPQGLALISKWRQLIPQSTPLVTIGGIGDPETAAKVMRAGSECVAVIGAVTSSNNRKDIAAAIFKLNKAMVRE